VRIAANQLRAEVILQVRGNGELASVQRGVTEADNPVIGGDFKGDKVPPRAGNKHVSRDNLHNSFPYIVRCDAEIYSTTLLPYKYNDHKISERSQNRGSGAPPSRHNNQHTAQGNQRAGPVIQR
jgi:hypothetical protein